MTIENVQKPRASKSNNHCRISVLEHNTRESEEFLGRGGEMESARAVLVAIFVSAFVFDQWCLVEANMADSWVFYWGEKRGKWTGPDSLDLVLEKYGGSGIKSKADFLYGSISAKIRLIPGDSAGTVTTFYISSTGDKHDEIDFEFLGNSTGEPYTIHTNIFTQGFGKREQQFKVWFDPTSAYHTYTIFWNPFAVVWLVDGTPIRVFRNYHDSQINFPDSQPMKAYASLWNADDWATQGGRVKTNWGFAPFIARFKNYRESVCYWEGKQSIRQCASSKSPKNWCASPRYYKLTDRQLGRMKSVRGRYMIYNYCTDYNRFKGNFPKECSLPQY